MLLKVPACVLGTSQFRMLCYQERMLLMLKSGLGWGYGAVGRALESCVEPWGQSPAMHSVTHF